MSTIASPRDTSVNGHKVPLISTPTSSSRPSLELPVRSTDVSPNPTTHPAPRRNRAALRSYYNLKPSGPPSETPDDASEASSIHDFNSDTPPSVLDSPSFDAQAYITYVLETQSLGELLKTYNGVLTDLRALDAEKKALVYDNYSKLIAATETIRRMRANMDQLNPMARTFDLAVVGIWEKAGRMREELKEQVPEAKRRELESSGDEKEKLEKRRRTREVVRGVLDTPERVRELVAEERDEEARVLWERSLRLLERWRERGVGGSDVLVCIEDGEAALRGEPPSEKSWATVKAK